MTKAPPAHTAAAGLYVANQYRRHVFALRNRALLRSRRNASPSRAITTIDATRLRRFAEDWTVATRPLSEQERTVLAAALNQTAEALGMTKKLRITFDPTVSVAFLSS